VGETQYHKEIRYIEGYREFSMTIWRQHFFGAANGARIRTPSPPHLSFPTWTPSQMSVCLNTTWGRGGGRYYRAIGLLEDLLSVIGWRSTWGRRGGGGDTSRDANMRITEYVPI